MLARLQEDFRPVGFLCRLLRLHFDFARQGANDDGDDEQEQKSNRVFRVKHLKGKLRCGKKIVEGKDAD